jgi:hypothetical protein
MYSVLFNPHLDTKMEWLLMFFMTIPIFIVLSRRGTNIIANVIISAIGAPFAPITAIILWGTLARVRYPRWLAFLGLIPVANTIFLLYLAIIPWPQAQVATAASPA